MLSRSASETFELGKKFGQQLLPNTVICFYGDLGAGKTTFIKGLAAGVLHTSGDEVNSPTFTYLNIYHGAMTLYHFDLYRLSGADEFLAMGFDEMFDAGGVCCLEWAEKLTGLNIPHAIHIEFSHIDEQSRQIVINHE